MLRLPLTATLLATLLLGVDGISVTPQVVVAVVVAFLVTAVLPQQQPELSQGMQRFLDSGYREHSPATHLGCFLIVPSAEKYKDKSNLLLLVLLPTLLSKSHALLYANWTYNNAVGVWS